MKRILIYNGKALTYGGKVLYNEDGTLPAGYTALEYVTLKSYLYTDYPTNNTSVIEAKLYAPSSSTSAYFWCSDSNSSGTTNTTAYCSNSGNWRWNGKSFSVQRAAISGAVKEIVQDKTGVKVDGTTIGTYSSPETFTSSALLHFGSSSTNLAVRYYYFRHTYNGVVVTDLTPAQDPDGNAGFWDYANDKFIIGGTAGPALT